MLYEVITDNKVYLDFDTSTMPPTEPIKLGKPTTVVDERAPVAPITGEVQPPPAPEEMAAAAPPPPMEEVAPLDEQALAAGPPPEKVVGLAPAETMPPPLVVGGVITSYSIHYTKLYDFAQFYRPLFYVVTVNTLGRPDSQGLGLFVQEPE